MEYKQGKPEHVAAAISRALFFIGMDGDGVQAPGVVVVKKNLSRGPKYAVRFHNTEFGGAGGGEYFDNLDQARSRCKERALRYDPRGLLRRSFASREEQAGLAQEAC